MLYTVGRFLHFSALFVWISGFFALEMLVKRTDRPQAAEILDDAIIKRTRVIMHAGAGIALTGGLMMIAAHSDILLRQGWLHAKLVLIALFYGATIKLGRDSRRAGPGNPFNSIWLHVIAGTVVAVVVFLAVFRPF